MDQVIDTGAAAVSDWPEPGLYWGKYDGGNVRDLLLIEVLGCVPELRCRVHNFSLFGINDEHECHTVSLRFLQFGERIQLPDTVANIRKRRQAVS